MFVYHQHIIILIPLLDVDYQLLSINNPVVIRSFISELSTHFAMKDLGEMHRFAWGSGYVYSF